MSIKEFDQTMSQGFRKLANKGCEKQAADLIELYIEKNNSTDINQRWHVAQLRGLSGDNVKAAQSARLSLRKDEGTDKNRMRWNDYVLATLAFFEGRKEDLVAYRNKVAEGKDLHFGNKQNLILLDRLIKHFGKSYKYALKDGT